MEQKKPEENRDKYKVVWKRRIDKQIAKMPVKMQNRFNDLVSDIRKTGPVQAGWVTFPPSGKTCTIAISATVGLPVGQAKKTLLLWRFTMLAVEKAHRIKLQMYGTGLDFVQRTLRKEYPAMEFSYDFEPSENPDDEEYIDSRDSGVMKEIAARMTPGDHLLIRRENKGWTQAKLSAKSGIAIPNISLMEAGKRPIGARTAKKLAAALGCDVSDFIV